MPAKSNIWLYLIIGVSCLLIGFAASTFAYRYRILRVPGGGAILERMNRELGLTPQQRGQIEAIMHDTRSKAMQMKREAQQQRHKLFVQSFSRIRDVLTAEQQQKVDRDFSPTWRHRGGRERDFGPPDEGGEPSQPAESPAPQH